MEASSPSRRTDPDAPSRGRRAQDIVDATLRVIAREGCEAVTHRSVAAEAGVPLGSTTYWFASRDALLREALRRYVERVEEALAGLARAHLRPTRAALLDFLVALARLEREDPAALVIEYELLVRAVRDPMLARTFLEYDRRLAARLAEHLERLAAPEPLAAARSLVALVRGYELEALLGGAPDPEELRARLGPFLAAVTPRSPAPRSARTRPKEPR